MFKNLPVVQKSAVPWEEHKTGEANQSNEPARSGQGSGRTGVGVFNSVVGFP